VVFWTVLYSLPVLIVILRHCEEGPPPDTNIRSADPHDWWLMLEDEAQPLYVRPDLKSRRVGVVKHASSMRVLEVRIRGEAFPWIKVRIKLSTEGWLPLLKVGQEPDYSDARLIRALRLKK
jgi:hypothetical protein